MSHLHISDLAIDRLLAGEPASADATAVRDRAAECPRCSALLDDALVTQRVFATHRAPLRLPRRRPAYAAMTMMAACAAALAVVAMWPRAEQERVRTKGTAVVGFYVAHRDVVRRGALSEVVVPGDRIELFTTTTEPMWFAAIADDATGARSVYVAPREVAPGREQVLPLSIELDNALGPAVVSGVFCAARFEATAIDPRAPPAGCSVDRFTLVVVPR